MFQRLLSISIAVLFLFVFTFSLSAQADSPQFEAGDCPFATPADALTPDAIVECGFLVVPENRSSDNGNVIRLAVAIFRAETPSADPVIFLQGGPGGGIVEQIAFYYDSLIAPITAERDFIVFDQRGTGLSTPALNCPEVTELFTESLREDYTDDQVNPLYVEAFDECRETLTGAGIDLSAYTSAASAIDIADLAATLGYETVNLYGGSYGTRLALTVMRDFPALVRSAILDGVLPPDANQIGIIASKSDYALSTFFQGCANDEACAAAYPDLEIIFYETVEALNVSPAPLTLTLPTTGETIETTVNGNDFIGSVFFGLQQTGLIPTLPATIQAVSEGDVTSLQTFITLPILLADNINVGIFQSVICAEEIPATTPDQLDQAAAEFPALEAFALSAYYGSGQAITDLCAAWGAAEYDPRESEPVVSDIPTLIISGEYDPATPSYLATQAGETLANDYAYVIPGAGHVASVTGGCPVQIVTSFLSDPSVEPDTDCLNTIAPTFQTPNSVIALIPVENAAFGFTSVIPEGWTEIVPNSGTYGENLSASVVMLQQIAPLSVDETLDLLGGQLGFTETPDSTGAVEGSGAAWTLYEVIVQGQPGDLALAQGDGETYIVLLISTPAQRDLYYNGAFLPALQAFAR